MHLHLIRPLDIHERFIFIYRTLEFSSLFRFGICKSLDMYALLPPLMGGIHDILSLARPLIFRVLQYR